MSTMLENADRGVAQGPDPTAATTQNILREVSALKDLFEQRIVAIERAIAVAHDDASRVPTTLTKELGSLEALIMARIETLKATFRTQDERFASIAKQFLERDTRTEQATRDSKVAVDAALQAAKEAVGKQNEASDRSISKSELSFTKQVDAQSVVVTAVKSELDRRITDIKEQVSAVQASVATIQAIAINRIESGKESREINRDSSATWIAVASGAISVIALIVSVLLKR